MADPFFESLYSEELYQPTLKTLVVVPTAWNKVGEEEQQLLSKILGSVKLNLESVKIIEQQQFNLSTWIEKPYQVISFSPGFDGLTKYEVIEADGISLVLSNSLNELINDEASRRKLWLALKQLFLV
jgi:DNA polymerase III psi subunit